jgi:pimeloyl-ACP methyl ester carboxylesterase
MIDHSYAYVNGIRLHYATSGEGKLILFAHGFPEFWYAWKNQISEFGRDHRAVAPDMRGYNLSEKPAAVEQYQVKLLCEDLRGLAEHLGAKRFILVGHDWGGAIAWVFALHYPRYLEKLVIINAPHPAVFERELRDSPAQQKASEYMLMLRRPEAEQILSANRYDFLYQVVLNEGVKHGYFSEEDCKAYLEAWSQPGAMTGGLNYYRAAHIGPATAGGTPARGNFVADASELTVKVPTLVIWGEKDPYLLTGNLEGLEEFVSDLVIQRIPHGTHWVVHEKPTLVNDLIRAFLRT